MLLLLSLPFFSHMCGCMYMRVCVSLQLSVHSTGLAIFFKFVCWFLLHTYFSPILSPLHDHCREKGGRKTMATAQNSEKKSENYLFNQGNTFHISVNKYAKCIHNFGLERHDIVTVTDGILRCLIIKYL